jgi:predicted acyl esterase
MRIRHLLPALAVAATGLALAPAGALAAAPLPFGHACQSKDGALFCPAATDAQRVPSFDGVPLDVDVWLPATGDGPFPTISMIHGWGGNKTNFQNNAAGYSAQYYARKGYAVVLSTARGFGRSCGALDSRTSPACDKGWIHLADARYEVRDQQTLLGALVDQGVAKAGALGATGISYGGGTSLQMAYLNDRIENPDGTYGPWTTAKGTKLSLGAAWPRWPWSDLADALAPNGRSWLTSADLYQYGSPMGVDLMSYQDGLYALGAANFLAPKGVDAGSDLQTWKARIDQGEPYDAKAKAYLKELHDHHGAGGIKLASAPAPLLIQNGWTDDLFPAWQGARPYQQIRRAFPRASVNLQLGDLGHSRGANHPGDNAKFNAAGLALFDRLLAGKAGKAPAPSVTAYGQSCPRAAKFGIGPWTSGTVAGLARGTLTINATPRKTITTKAIDKTLDAKVNGLIVDPCVSLPAAKDTAAGIVVLNAPSPGITLLGSTAIAITHPKASGTSQIVARIWDVDPKTKTMRLVDRSVTRPVANATKETLRLNGNGWKFAKGHRIRVELTAGDPPTFRRSNGSFSLRILTAKATLPTREPGRR